MTRQVKRPQRGWRGFVVRIEAIYQGGAFKLLTEVQLPENQRVLIDVQPIEDVDPLLLLRRMQERQQQIIDDRGCFPDSTPDIAEDRMRDV
jgi:predicted DNA-binding antitoxin AbrB/MazE fold protein